MVLFYLFVLGGTAVVSVPFTVLTGHIPLTPDLASRLAPTFFFGLVAVGLLVFYLANARRQSARHDSKYAQYWQARARWEHLYACQQCGSVFNPTEPDRFVPASRMKELLA
jgi:hypothetical protein